jgi:hypothetical protein
VLVLVLAAPALSCWGHVRGSKGAVWFTSWLYVLMERMASMGFRHCHMGGEYVGGCNTYCWVLVLAAPASSCGGHVVQCD